MAASYDEVNTLVLRHAKEKIKAWLNCEICNHPERFTEQQRMEHYVAAIASAPPSCGDEAD